MSKLDIVNEVANKTGITKTKAEIAVETVLKSLKRALAHGEHIELRGLSVKDVRLRKVRTGSTLPAVLKLPYKSNLNQKKLRRAVAEVAAEEARRPN